MSINTLLYMLEVISGYKMNIVAYTEKIWSFYTFNLEKRCGYIVITDKQHPLIRNQSNSIATLRELTSSEYFNRIDYMENEDIFILTYDITDKFNTKSDLDITKSELTQRIYSLFNQIAHPTI